MLRELVYAGDFSKLTSFFSVQYLVLFLPAVLLMYGLTPGSKKRYTLMLSSMAFFFLISRRFIVYLLVNILSIWLFGLWLDRLHRQRDAQVKAAEKPQRKEIKRRWLMRSRWVLALAAAFHIGLLLVLKYSGFFVENVNVIFGREFPVPSFVIPIGISFFTLQAVSYLFDVYRDTQKADRNLARLALFLSFFPQIVEGPICRYSQTADQLWDAKPISWENFTLGIQRIGYGLLKKLVIADRLNSFVEGVFSDYMAYEGGIIAIAAVCYTVQLYMDFSGAMDAVSGTAQIFGITMPENFRQPFFARSVSEFWTRWHISLGGWFKDYIFYPVSMSKPVKNLTGKVKKKLGSHTAAVLAGGIALFCVWLCNGLWHGAAWSYIFFGMYHFVLIFSGNLAANVNKRIRDRLRIRQESKLFQLFQILRTCVLVVIGELFFRAEGLRAGIGMFCKMVTDFHFTTLNGQRLRPLQTDGKDFLIVGITLLIILAISIAKERGVHIRQQLQKQPVAVRWALWYALIFYILIFGAYGVGYIPVNPMYANF